MDTATLSVSALYVYPVKSCRGTEMDAAEVSPCGFAHDREFMVVDGITGLFLTQREAPRLALIRPFLEDDALRLEAPGMSPLALTPVTSGPVRDVIVWQDRCCAVDQGGEAAGWLTRFLGVDCRLVRMAEDHVRPVDPRYAVGRRDRVGFADGYPFLLLSRESLDDLNARLAAPVPMNRFRPNIVVAGGGAPFLEDRWRRIRIGSVTFYVVKPCARCVITTVDQDSAVPGREPLATLARYRNSPRGVLFGQNLIHAGTGTIRRGDPVTVLA